MHRCLATIVGLAALAAPLTGARGEEQNVVIQLGAPAPVGADGAGLFEFRVAAPEQQFGFALRFSVPQAGAAAPVPPPPPPQVRLGEQFARAQNLVGITPLMVAFEGPIGGGALELLRARGQHLQFSLLHAHASWTGPGRASTSAGVLGFGAKTNFGADASTELGFLSYPLSFATTADRRDASVGFLLTKLYLRQYFGWTFLELGAASPLVWYTQSRAYDGPNPIRGYLGFGIDL